MGFGNGEPYMGLQYLGLPGISRHCLDGIMRLLQFGDQITHARILSCNGTHCLLLTINTGGYVAIRSASGHATKVRVHERSPKPFGYFNSTALRLTKSWFGRRSWIASTARR